MAQVYRQYWPWYGRQYGPGMEAVLAQVWSHHWTGYGGRTGLCLEAVLRDLQELTLLFHPSCSTCLGSWWGLSALVYSQTGAQPFLETFLKTPPAS